MEIIERSEVLCFLLSLSGAVRRRWMLSTARAAGQVAPSLLSLPKPLRPGSFLAGCVSRLAQELPRRPSIVAEPSSAATSPGERLLPRVDLPQVPLASPLSIRAYKYHPRPSLARARLLHHSAIASLTDELCLTADEPPPPLHCPAEDPHIFTELQWSYWSPPHQLKLVGAGLLLRRTWATIQLPPPTTPIPAPATRRFTVDSSSSSAP